VFALFSASCNPLAGVNCGNEGLSLQFNAGHGWQTLYQAVPSGVHQLTGFPNGPLALLGGSVDGYGLSLVEEGSAKFARAFEDPIYKGFFVVHTDLAYAVDGKSVLEYSNGEWLPLATLPVAGSGIWADEDTIAIVGADQAFYLQSAGESDFRLLEDVPAGNYWSVWGFGADDLWAGNQAGQIIHYDGSLWEVFTSGSTDTTGGGIAQLWGADGQVYFRTATEFGRVAEGDSEILIRRESASEEFRIGVTGIWGLSPSEVFITLTDTNYDRFACGGEFILWFDGSEFHQF
jgi:hypothetical protein